MRDILFRGKNIRTGEWEYGGLIYMFGKIPCIYTTNKEEVRYRQVDLMTVGQYTGKQYTRIEQKIFEGDILKGFSCDKDLLGIVRWDEEEASFYIETANEFYNMADIDIDTKVVGNEWDNPELLEQIDVEE